MVVIDPEASKTSTVGTDAACGAGPGAGTLDALGPLAGDGAGAADPLVAVLHAAAVTARTDPRTATTARCQLTRSDMPPHATVRGAARVVVQTQDGVAVHLQQYPGRVPMRFLFWPAH